MPARYVQVESSVESAAATATENAASIGERRGESTVGQRYRTAGPCPNERWRPLALTHCTVIRTVLAIVNVDRPVTVLRANTWKSYVPGAGTLEVVIVSEYPDPLN